MKIGKIAGGSEYRIDEELKNLPIFGVKFRFFKFKTFWKFVNFSDCKILKIW